MLKLLATTAIVSILATPASALVIKNDPGGNLGTRHEKIEALRSSGEKVKLIGECSSSCTAILSLPPAQICATKNARLGFHAMMRAVKKGSDKPLIVRGKPVLASRELQEFYMEGFPQAVKDWLDRSGALTTHKITYVPATKFIRLCTETEKTEVNTPATGASPVMTSNWMQGCRSSDKAESDYCLGYIRGHADAFQFWRIMAKDNAKICIPAQVSSKELRESVFDYVKKHPEEKTEPLGLVAPFAFLEKWACEESQD